MANGELTSQATVCRQVHQVLDALVKREGRFIRFETDPQTLTNISNGFFDMYGFPNCVGLLDGTQIPIFRPYKNPEMYVNRKGSHSINVQVSAMGKKM